MTFQRSDISKVFSLETCKTIKVSIVLYSNLKNGASRKNIKSNKTHVDDSIDFKGLPAIPAATVMKKALPVSVFTNYLILFLVIATFTATSGVILTLLSISLGVQYGIFNF